MSNKKEELDLCSTKKWFLIADVFKGHGTDKVKIFIKSMAKWYQFLIR